jgi:quercetin dioxygenase-like cupin family protein
VSRILAPLAIVVLLAGCAGHGRSAGATAGAARGARAAIIPAEGGEHRVLRGRKLIALKIDPVTVGSEHLFLGTERMAPGDSIPTHQHSGEEEAIFVHRGVLDARVGDERGQAGPGATVFIPQATWVALANRGADTAEFVYVFNEPAFAGCLRAFSVPHGEAYVEPAPDSAARIRQLCHQVVPEH